MRISNKSSSKNSKKEQEERGLSLNVYYALGTRMGVL